MTQYPEHRFMQVQIAAPAFADHRPEIAVWLAHSPLLSLHCPVNQYLVG
jgi:hypothetical protein